MVIACPEIPNVVIFFKIAKSEHLTNKNIY